MSDLGYDDQWKAYGRLKIDMPSLIPNLYLMYTPMKWSETGRKNVDFSFGGENFSGDVDFDSELKMNHLDAALYYGIPGVRAATADILNIDVGLNFRFLDFRAELEQDDIGEKESESYFLPIPMLYAATQIKPIGWIALDLEGHRYDNIKIDYQDVDIDAEFRGPFAEVGIDF